MLCADLNLPNTAQEQLLEQMNEQISGHDLNVDAGVGIDVDVDVGRDINVSDERKEESRHIVRLDVRIGRVVIRDQFEWDLSERMNNADAFAERLWSDLGLNTEHVGSVAHAISEQ